MQAAAKTLADELIDWDELLQCMSLVVGQKQTNCAANLCL